MLKPDYIKNNESGFSMMNILATLGVLSILSAIAISNLKEINNPLADASFQVTHFLREARSKAMSKTVTIKVSPISAFALKAEKGNTCDPTEVFTPLDIPMRRDFPNGASLTDTTWEICFTKRGLATASATFDLQDLDGQTRTVEVALGGASRIQ